MWKNKNSDKPMLADSAADQVTAEAALRYAGRTTAQLARALYRITKALEDKDKQLAEHGYDLQNPLRRGFMLAEDLVKKTIADL